MNQIMSFSATHGLYYVLNLVLDKKDMTSRLVTERRTKLNVGDIIYGYISQRAKVRLKLFDAKIKERIKWKAESVPLGVEEASDLESPRKNYSWLEFAYRDGFSNYYDFMNFFKNHTEGDEFYCFVWKVFWKADDSDIVQFLCDKFGFGLIDAKCLFEIAKSLDFKI